MVTLSPLGKFLEISFASHNVLEDMALFKELGFQELQVGEIVDHPYGVVSDGRLCLGLHNYDFADLALTYVLPDLAQRLGPLRNQVGKFEYQKTQPDEFNELCILDPAGLPIRVLEARTFSPANFGGAEDVSICGRFQGLALASNDIAQREAFFEGLGFISDTSNDHANLVGDGLNLYFFPESGQKKATLKFQSPDLESVIRHAASLGIVFSDVTESETGIESVTLDSKLGCYLTISQESDEESDLDVGAIEVTEG